MVEEYRQRFTNKERAWWNWYLNYLESQQRNMCKECHALTTTFQSFAPRPSQENCQEVENKKKAAVDVHFCSHRVEGESAKASIGLPPDEASAKLGTARASQGPRSGPGGRFSFVS
jgi:hypothetical protein